MWKYSAVGFFISTERGLDTIVAGRRGDPGAAVMVQVSVCISQPGDFSLNLKAAPLPEHRKTVIQFELSSVGRNMQRLCLMCLRFSNDPQVQIYKDFAGPQRAQQELTAASCSS